MPNDMTSATEPTGQQPLRVLIVEDHDDTRFVLVRLLERLGYAAGSARDGADALAIVAQQPFDVLVIDIGLPDMTGLDLMRELGRLYGLPGVAMTGLSSAADIDAARDAGFTEHVTKPAAIDVIVAAIKKAAATRGPAK